MSKEEKNILKVIGILLILGILIGCGFLIKNLIDKDNKHAKKDKGVCCDNGTGYPNCNLDTSGMVVTKDECLNSLQGKCDWMVNGCKKK